MCYCVEEMLRFGNVNDWPVLPCDLVVLLYLGMGENGAKMGRNLGSYKNRIPEI